MNSPNAVLVLDDGSFYIGNFIGAEGEAGGELCFNTSMTGYQEVLSDPSYYAQMVVFTFPHIGNVGVNSEDNESDDIHLRGIIVNNGISAPSNHRAEDHLNLWLKKRNLVGICSVDTRSIVKKIRNTKHPIKSIIGSFDPAKKREIVQNLYDKLKDETGLSGQDYTINVQSIRTSIKRENKVKQNIVILDFGLKKSIFNAVKTKEFETIVIPGDSSLEEIYDCNPVGIILSNGPGDPRSTIASKSFVIQELVHSKIPLLGICLGFQLIGLSLGGTIVQLPCGHHGSNHPVYDLNLKKTLITSQNHEFHLLIETLPSFIKPSYISLFDKSLEGFLVENKPIVAVQFHPEGHPGPNDCSFIFNDFLKLVKEYAKKK